MQVLLSFYVYPYPGTRRPPVATETTYPIFEKRPSLYELATRSSAIAILGAGGLRYDGASRAGAGTLPPGPTAGHARRANRASTRFTSVEQASEEGVEEGVKWALSQLAAP